MIIYKDLVTGDEVLSDSYPMKLVDDIVYEAEGEKIQVGGEEIDIGANPSAEDGEDALDDNKQMVLNIAHSFRLSETSFDKKSYLGHLKGYMKNIKKKLEENGSSPEEVKAFETGAAAYAKKIIANFKDYEFLIGESMDPDGMVLLLNYREDGITPYVTVWKHGLTEMKV